MTPLAATDLTVVVPVRDGVPFVADALRSIAGQRGGAPRLIVVDDGSTDGTGALVRETAPGAVVLARSGLGPGAARMVGVRAATTELVAFCDADDRWPPDRILHDLAYFDGDPGLEVLIGRTRHEADDSALLDRLRFDNDERDALIPSFGAVTARRAVFSAVGAIDGEQRHFEDYDWLLRVRETAVVLRSHDAVSQIRRMRPDSFSHSDPATASDLLGTLKRSLERRRDLGVESPLPTLTDAGRERPEIEASGP